MALNDANRLLATIETSPATLPIATTKAAANASLEAAAKAVNRPVLSVGPLGVSDPGPIPGYSLSDAARPQFIRQAFGLLRKASESNPHPLGILELPRPDEAGGRASVAQLSDHHPLEQRQTFAVEAVVSRRLLQDVQSDFQLFWLNYDNLLMRIEYKEDRDRGPKIPTEPIPNTPIGT